ncbi:glycosyltransferase family 2 protein [bacterium]|nr:glycosyltransferase family 2 protein [bacterium]
MKERIVLLLIIFTLWVFLFIFQNYMDKNWATFTIIGFTILYCIYMQIAFKHRTRQLKKHPKVVNENYKPFVSIMIPAHNEEDVISQTIENVAKLDYPQYEIIVIDDRSTDNTAGVLQELTKTYPNLITFSRKDGDFPGKSAVLNDALKYAHGEAILVLDADARVNPDFLTKLVPALEDEDVGAVQARKVISNKNDNLLTRCQSNELTLDTHFQVGRDAVRGAVELRGNGEIIKRIALNDIGGWNNYTITDDLDMSTRLQIKGWDVRFCPEVCVYEEAILHYIPLLKQRRRWVEGSIRRYLEHFEEVLTSKDMSLRVSLDMTAYITEFLMPFWMTSEICFQFFRFVKGVDNWILSSIAISIMFCIFFSFALMYSLRKYDGLKPFENLVQSVTTCLYMVFLWFPVVFFIVFKIIFCKKTMDWGKTTHGTAKTTIVEGKETLTSQ